MGGLVGNNQGTITRSRTDVVNAGTTSPTHTLGGIAGLNSGTITDVQINNTPYLNSATEATCGGVVGENSGGSISNSFVSGSIGCKGSSNFVGGLVGNSTGSGVITNNAVNVQVDYGTNLDGAIVGHNVVMLICQPTFTTNIWSNRKLR